MQIKKLLLHDDPQGNYLIYDPFSYAHPQDNWLLDMEKYSESFRADYTSLLMEDLHIEPSPPLRKTMKRYATFFANKERVDKLRRLGAGVLPDSFAASHCHSGRFSRAEEARGAQPRISSRLCCLAA